MTTDLRYLLSTFQRRDRLQLAFFILVQFLVATLDLIGIAAVLPLMQTLTGASVEEGWLGRLHGLLGGGSPAQFTVTLAVLMSIAFLLKAALASLAAWWSSGLIVRLQVGTARSLLERYLSESYLAHRGRDTGEVLATVGSGVQGAHVGVLGGLLAAISSAMSIGLIVLFLLVVAPLPSLAATAYFAVAVFALQRVTCALARQPRADCHRPRHSASRLPADSPANERQSW